MHTHDDDSVKALKIIVAILEVLCAEVVEEVGNKIILKCEPVVVASAGRMVKEKIVDVPNDAENLGNIVMLLPFGILYPLFKQGSTWKRTVIAGFVTTLGIELLQSACKK